MGGNPDDMTPDPNTGGLITMLESATGDAEG